MKWTNEKIEELINLVDKGYRPSEISNMLGTTIKSINLKMSRLGVKVKYISTFLCKNCGSSFNGYIKDNRVFCSKSCSSSFNNTNRSHSDLTKKKISEKLKLKTNDNTFKKIEKGKITTTVPRKCKICNNFKVVKKRKSICDECKIDYYDFYRTECKFEFSIFDYPNEFDLYLIDDHGWYSPSNKRNNLKGVSKDHMYSVMDGYLNKIPAEIISHPANCKLLLYSDNSRKKNNSSISIDELKNRIYEWDKKYKQGIL